MDERSQILSTRLRINNPRQLPKNQSIFNVSRNFTVSSIAIDMDPFRGPQPKSLLGRHRVLSPSASIRVSPLFLGTSVFGTAW